MSDISISEAKQITGKLEQLLLKLSGTKNEDGSTNKIGLIEELEILQTKLNPTSVKYIGDLEREKTLESLRQIEKLFEGQKQNIEELSLNLKSSLEEVAKGYLQDMQVLGENTLHEWLEPSVQNFEERLEKILLKFDNTSKNNILLKLFLYSISAFVVGLISGSALKFI